MAKLIHDEEKVFHNELDASRNDFQKLANFYDNWSEKYDAIDGPCATELNSYTAEQLSRKIPNKENSVLLDVACGTGLVGEAVYNKGFHNIDGVDLSEGMLAQAKEKGVYRKLFQGCITPTSKVSVEDNTYDGVFCSQGISVGMLDLELGLKEMIRVTKSNGILCYTVNLKFGIAELMRVHSELLISESIELISMEKRPYYRKIGEAQKCYYCIMKKI